MSAQVDRPLTVRELADRLRVSLATAYNLVSRGKIISHRIGGAIRIFESSLDRYLAGSIQQVSAPVQEQKPVRIRLKHLKLK